MQSASTVITELLQLIAVQCISVKIHIFNTVQCGRAVKVIHNQVDLGGNDTPAMAVLIVLCLFVDRKVLALKLTQRTLPFRPVYTGFPVRSD